jgi:hypothetical protein
MTDSDDVDLPGERDRVADERDAIAERRDARADARDRVSDVRELKVDTLLAAAEIRDARAAARDLDADQRDQADLLYAIVHDVDDTRTAQGRTLAGTDRVHAKADRIASQVDRTVLADVGHSGNEREAAMKDVTAAAVERVEAAKSRDRAAKRRGRPGRPLRVVAPEDPAPPDLISPARQVHTEPL